MTSIIKYRFPGLNSYTKDDGNIFKGRESEKLSLFNNISLYKTLVLHAESGTGKSSLIQAGLLPHILTTDERYVPVIIKMNEIIPGNGDNILIEYILKKIKEEYPEISNISLDLLVNSTNSLWKINKQFESEKKKILLIFDQFENIQSFKNKQINYFKSELYDLLNSKVPPILYNSIEENFSKNLKTEKDKNLLSLEYNFLNNPSLAKVLFVIREDKLGVMSLLSDYFPDILKNDFIIKPLSQKAAFVALTEPTKAIGNFISPPFEYENNEIITSLIKEIADNETGLVDPIQLQIVAKNIEATIIKSGITIVTKADIPNINDIISTYYSDCWNKVNNELDKSELSGFLENKLEIRKEIITKLVVKNRRSLADFGSIKNEKILNVIILILLNEGLIREINYDPRTKYYQLCHDRLIDPVVKDIEYLKAQKRISREIEKQKNELLKENIAALEKANQEKENAIISLSIANNEKDAAFIEIEKANYEKEKLIVSISDANGSLKLKNNILAGVFALSILFIAGLTYFIIKYNKKTSEIANVYQKLNDQYILVSKSGDTIRRKNDSLSIKNATNDSLIKKLDSNQNYISSLLDKANEDKLKLKKSNLEKDLINTQLLLKKNSLDSQSKYLTKLTNSYEIERTEKSIRDSSFYGNLSYSRNKQDSILRDRAANILLHLKLGDKYNDRITTIPETENTEYASLLEALNNATTIKSSVVFNNDRLDGILKIKKVYERKHDSLIGDIGLSMINNQWVNIQNISLSQYSSDLYGFTYGNKALDQINVISNDKSHFAFFLGGQSVILGSYVNRALKIDTSLSKYSFIENKRINNFYDYYNSSNPKAIQFNSQNKLMVLVKNSIFEFDPKGKNIKQVSSSSNIDDYNIAKFSPDATKLFTDYYDIKKKKYCINIYSTIYNSSVKKMSISISQDSIKNIILSDDNQYAIIVDIKNNAFALNLINKSVTSIQKRYKYIGFISNSNYIIASDENLLCIFNPSFDTLKFQIDLSKIGLPSFWEINSIIFSRDWSKLLIGYNGLSSSFYIKNSVSEHDSIFKLSGANINQTNNQQTQLTTIPNSSISILLADNSVLSIDNRNYYSSQQSLKLWRNFGKFDDFDKAYNLLGLNLSISTKVEKGLISPESLQNEDNKTIFSTANEIYKTYSNIYSFKNNDYLLNDSKIKLGISLSLFNRLLEVAPYDPNYLDGYKAVAKKIFEIDSNYTNLSKSYNHIVEIEENNLKIFKGDTLSDDYKTMKRNTSSDYSDFAWYLLHINNQNCQEIIDLTKRALQLDSSNDIIITNMVLAYFLNNDTIIAKRLYEKYKNKTCKTCSLYERFSYAFIKDLYDLQFIFKQRSTDLDKKRKKVIDFLSGGEVVLYW